jgi:hypothetical protein
VGESIGAIGATEELNGVVLGEDVGKGVHRVRLSTRWM